MWNQGESQPDWGGLERVEGYWNGRQIFNMPQDRQDLFGLRASDCLIVIQIVSVRIVHRRFHN